MLVMDLRDAGEAVREGRGLLGDSPLCYVNIPLEPAPTGKPAPAGQTAPSGQAAPVGGGATLDFISAT